MNMKMRTNIEMKGNYNDTYTPSFLSKKLLSKKSINEIIKDNHY